MVWRLGVAWVVRTIGWMGCFRCSGPLWISPPSLTLLSTHGPSCGCTHSLPPVKLHCSMLAEDAIKAAIKDYQKKTGRKVEQP